MYMKDEKIVEIDDYRLELENRIRNLLWTISGDYTLNMKVDVSLYLRSKAIALYDGIKQGALAKYYDRNLLGLYLVKKVFCQAGEGELTAVAQLCVEEAIGDKICQVRFQVAEKKCTKINANQAGTGAAGGLGFAFLSFTNAVLESGIKIVLEETSLEKYMENADIVITGEGRLDGQTAMGKAPVGVARLAKKHNIPVTAFAGSVTKEAIACNQNGIDAFFPILRGVTTLEDAMKPENAKANMADTVEQVFRLLNIRRK